MMDEKDAGSEDQASERFYELLPRFVYDLPEMGKDNFLPLINREIKFNKREYILTIVPILKMRRTLQGLSDDMRDLFPGPNEKRLEKAFRRLSTEDNVNFHAERLILCFSLSQIIEEYAAITNGEKQENMLSFFNITRVFQISEICYI